MTRGELMMNGCPTKLLGGDDFHLNPGEQWEFKVFMATSWRSKKKYKPFNMVQSLIYLVPSRRKPWALLPLSNIIRYLAQHIPKDLPGFIWYHSENWSLYWILSGSHILFGHNLQQTGGVQQCPDCRCFFDGAAAIRSCYWFNCVFKSWSIFKDGIDFGCSLRVQQSLHGLKIQYQYLVFIGYERYFHISWWKSTLISQIPWVLSFYWM